MKIMDLEKAFNDLMSSNKMSVLDVSKASEKLKRLKQGERSFLVNVFMNPKSC